MLPPTTGNRPLPQDFRRLTGVGRGPTGASSEREGRRRRQALIRDT